MGKYKTNDQLQQENYTLRQQVKVLRARVDIATAERDAARTALHNYNFTECAKEIERGHFLPAKW